MTVTANVPEADAGSVRTGRNATVTFSASQTTAEGEVTEVSLESSTSNSVVQYPVTVTLEPVPSQVRPGATASIVITTGSKSDVLTLPTSAITAAGSRSTVTVEKNGVQSTRFDRGRTRGGQHDRDHQRPLRGRHGRLPTSTSSSAGSSGVPQMGGGTGSGAPAGGGPGERTVSVPVPELRGVTKVYGEGETVVRAVAGVDLLVERGEHVAVMGASGSGKPTPMHILGCLDAPTNGSSPCCATAGSVSSCPST